MKIRILIPARLESSRFPKKLLQRVSGKTLIEHSIDYAKSSKYVKEIFVSSDATHIEDIANLNNVKYINRPADLLGEAEVADIYVDFVKKVNCKDYAFLIGLQPDHPDRTNNLDELLEGKFFL